MDNTYRYSQYENQIEPEISESTLIKSTITWYDPFFDAAKKHEKVPTFSFAPLAEIRRDYLKAGYSTKEVESIVVGLSELPEYANNKRNKNRHQKD